MINHQFKISGDMSSAPDHLVYRMVEVHKILVNTCKVHYHSVSVVYRPQDLGAIIIFSSDMKNKITPDIKQAITNSGFKHIFTFK